MNCLLIGLINKDKHMLNKVKIGYLTQGSDSISKGARELVRGIDKLVSLPEVCFLVNDLVNDPHASVDQIGQVISQDPDLTARLLKLVNSNFYSVPQRVETVSRAIMFVGLRELQNMVWASTAVETFNKVPANLVNMAAFWRHSIFTAVVARILASEVDILHPERLFISGLIHDLGRLVVYIKAPEKAKQVLEQEKESPGAPVGEIEREVLGFDHSEVGAALFEAWNLPGSLQTAVRYHHHPALAKDYLLETSILHVANMMAHALELGEEDNFIQECDPQAWARLNLPEKKIKRILQDAVMQFIEALELLLPGASQRM